MLAVENTLNDIELGMYGGWVGSRAIAFENCDDFMCLFMPTLSNEQTRRVRKERAQCIDAEGKEDLES